MSTSPTSGRGLMQASGGSNGTAAPITSNTTAPIVTVESTTLPRTTHATATDVAAKSAVSPLIRDGKRTSLSFAVPIPAHPNSTAKQGPSADRKYLSQRKLHRHVSTWELWGFCVGVVICGEYTGWQGGLASGWINLAVSTVLSIVIYAGALWSEVDMSTALPFSSAHTAFAHAAFGPAVGAMNGFIVMLSFAQQAATNVALISRYVKRILHLPPASVYPLWVFFYSIMIFMNLNSKRFFQSTLVINTYCCLALVGYMIWAGSRMPAVADWTWLSFSGASQFTSQLTLIKVIDSLPYAIWWFVGIESFPVVAEELESVEGSTSRAVNWGMSTLFFYSLTLIWIVPVLPPFSPGLATTDYPVGLSILEGLFGINPQIDPLIFDLARRILFMLLLLWAQGVTPTANIYAASRYMYGLSRGGLLPTSLSLTNESFMDVVTSLANWIPLSTSLKKSPFKTRRRPLGDVSRSNRTLSGADYQTWNSHSTPSQSSHNRRTNNPPDTEATLSPSARSVLRSLQKTSNRSRERTPVRAVLASVFVAYCFNWLLELLAFFQSLASADTGSSGDQAFDQVIDFLLRVAVWFACISHAVQLASYIRIRLAIKSLDRPSPSPIGISGAIFAFLVVILFGIVGPFLLNTPVYWVSALLLFAGSAGFLVYFDRFARPRLKNSPERLFIRSILNQRHTSGGVETVDEVPATGVGEGATSAGLGMLSTTLPALMQTQEVEVDEMTTTGAPELIGKQGQPGE